MHMITFTHLREDIPLRVRWLNNIKATRFAVENAKHKTTLKEQTKWFDDYENNKEKKFFTICDDKKPIGFMGLSKINKKKKVANIFILIGDDKYRGKGFGKLAMDYLINFGFKNLKLNKLELEVDLNNLPALSLYQKLGFRKEKRNNKEAKLSLSRNTLDSVCV